MSVAATIAPSPGWYPDPHGPDHLRWWDGSGWTDHVTGAPRPTGKVVAEAPFVADILPSDLDLFDDADPIEFSWEDTFEAFVVTVDDFEPAATPEPAAKPEPEPVQPGPFAFRARPLGSAPAPERASEAVRDLPVYGSPLATISSPLPARAAVVAEVEPQVLSAPETEVETGAEAEPRPAPPTHTRSPVPRRALTGSAALVVAAAAAAGITNLLRGDDASDRPAGPVVAPISTADRTCLKEWNTTASGTAAELRVTLGQFTGAYARVGRVDPLPGTLMAPDSCALTVYDPATDTNAVFVSGVKDQLGYMDVTSYPRAKSYGWPKSERQANVAIREDGAILAL
ncbi:MAG: DUF2510 domain-containing protein [Solirubrobacteraceae bacterium]